jgi:hypothetical protein
MKCAEIKELLSEYMDGILDAQKKALVEEHLTACKVCSEEFGSLKAYVKELRSLKRVEAPEDFLQKVHERLEEYSAFEKVIRKLFIPVRIKVPLEMAGVAATVVLAIFAFNFTQSQRRTAYLPLVTEPAETAEKQVEQVAAPESRKEVPVIVTELAKSKAPLPGEERKPIELVLLVKADMSAVTYSRRLGIDMNTSLNGRMKTGEIAGDDKMARMAPKGVPMLRDEARLLSYEGEALAKVKNMTESANGNVVSVEYEKETNLPQLVTIQIPLTNYDSFLEKLGQFGDLQKPLPSKPVESEGLVHLQIKFVPSK